MHIVVISTHNTATLGAVVYVSILICSDNKEHQIISSTLNHSRHSLQHLPTTQAHSQALLLCAHRRTSHLQKTLLL